MMRTVQFLQLPSGKEIYLHEPPPDLELSRGEVLIEKDVLPGEYQRLSDSTYRQFKLYDLVEGMILSRFAPPTEINYRLLNLHRNEILEKGLRLQVDYYRHFDGTNYTDLIVREVYHYRFNRKQIPCHQRIAIQWLLRDDSVGYTKHKERYFTGTEPLKLHSRRKNANVMNVKATLSEFFATHLGDEEGQQKINRLFDALFQAIETYIKGQEQLLINEFKRYPEPALDYPIHAGANAPTIRQYVIDALTISLVQPAS